MIFKIIVAGSRTFSDYKLLKNKLDNLQFKIGEFEIISGSAQGADQLSEEYAKENNLNIMKFPANWNKYGKKAGYIRNKEMAEFADACIVFWDGKSKGIYHMINLANQYKIPISVIKYE